MVSEGVLQGGENGGRGSMDGLTALVSQGSQPGKLHLGGGLRGLGRLLGGLLGGLGRLFLCERNGRETEYEAEGEGDVHQFLHSCYFSFKFRRLIRLQESYLNADESHLKRRLNMFHLSVPSIFHCVVNHLAP